MIYKREKMWKCKAQEILMKKEGSGDPIINETKKWSSSLRKRKGTEERRQTEWKAKETKFFGWPTCDRERSNSYESWKFGEK